MNGELGQLICLATYGTTWLRDDETSPPPALDANTTFKYVQSTEFTRNGQVLTGTADWLRDLRLRGFERLWLALPGAPPARSRWPYLEPHMEVAFANGGYWFGLATGSGPSEAWRARWSVIEPRPADNRIWAVRYEGRPATDQDPPQADVARASSALDVALDSARLFALGAEQPEWAAQFTDAIETDDDRPPYMPDLMAPDYPADARRLIAKAGRSWVFGGMGSWNDVGFTDETTREEHANVSRLLFAAVFEACLAAVNCPLPD